MKADMRWLRQLIILITSFISCPVLSLAADYTAQVVGVVDGDTIEVLRQDKTKERIRMYGIDCPERRQPFSVRAKEAASVLMFGKEGQSGNSRPGSTRPYARISVRCREECQPTASARRLVLVVSEVRTKRHCNGATGTTGEAREERLMGLS
jgi:endonuclease YncB( thermonuclease family)